MSSVAPELTKKRKVVLDTAAFIKQAKFETFGNEFFTLPEVLAEIRDSKARLFLETLPFKIQTREPSPEAVSAIVSFAKKTGDYPSLSKVDMKVLALAYTLEKECAGSAAHLRTEPMSASVVDEKKHAGPTFALQTPTAVLSSVKATAASSKTSTRESSPAPHKTPSSVSASASTETKAIETSKTDDADPSTAAEAAGDAEPKEAADKPRKKTRRGKRKGAAAKASGVVVNDADQPSESLPELQGQKDAVLPEVSASASATPVVVEPERPVFTKHVDEPTVAAGPEEDNKLGMGDWEDDDEESGWVTPENVVTYTRSFSGQTEADAAADAQRPVTCVTADFAMQNVLLQMGLHLTSMDGLSIKALQRWILRCYGCKLIIKDMDKLFCPRCGNHTLHRVQYTVDDAGSIVLQNVKDKISIRGTKYSVPLPKGGRKNNDIILSEGQLPAYRRRRKGVDMSDPDAILFGSDKRSSHKDVVVGYGRKNPNEPRKHFGKKNKAKRPGF